MHVRFAATRFMNAFDNLWREYTDGDVLRDYGFAFTAWTFEVDAHVLVIDNFVRFSSNIGGRAECGEWRCTATTI